MAFTIGGIPGDTLVAMGSTPVLSAVATGTEVTFPFNERFDSIKNPSNHFVAILDILGFTNLVQNPRDGMPPDQHLKKVYNTLDTDFYMLKDFLKRKGKAKGGPAKNTKFKNCPTHTIDPSKIENNPGYWNHYGMICRRMTFFSDTILLNLESSDSKKVRITQLKAMCDVINDLITLCALYPSLKKRFQIMIRGGLAYGLAYFDFKKHIYCGKPIIDAYSLSEGQEWMGASLHESINFIVDDANSLGVGLVGFNSPLLKYEIPLKCEYKKKLKKMGETEPLYALNWVQRHQSLPEYTTEILDYDYPRPLWNDLMVGNILKYNDWGNVENYKENMEEFARTIIRKFDKSKRYCRKRF